MIVFLILGPVITSLASHYNQTPIIGSSTRTQSTTGSSNPPAHEYIPGPPDLNPPPVKAPQDYAQIDQLLKQNPLYTQQLSTTQCGSQPIDLNSASKLQLEVYLNTFVNCLMTTWYSPVMEAGFTLPHPVVTVYTEPINSPCGELGNGNAFYCTADQRIYYSSDLLTRFADDHKTTRFIAEAVVAHEFGHSVQYRTMILGSENVLQADAEDDSEQQELSRRLEMQADCFAGLFINSVATSVGLNADDRQQILALFTSFGGKRPNTDDHGTGTNRALWASQGLSSTTPGSCNTFTADKAQVG